MSKKTTEPVLVMGVDNNVRDDVSATAIVEHLPDGTKVVHSVTTGPALKALPTGDFVTRGIIDYVDLIKTRNANDDHKAAFEQIKKMMGEKRIVILPPRVSGKTAALTKKYGTNAAIQGMNADWLTVDDDLVGWDSLSNTAVPPTLKIVKHREEPVTLFRIPPAGDDTVMAMGVALQAQKAADKAASATIASEVNAFQDHLAAVLEKRLFEPLDHKRMKELGLEPKPGICRDVRAFVVDKRPPKGKEPHARVPGGKCVVCGKMTTCMVLDDAKVATHCHMLCDVTYETQDPRNLREAIKGSFAFGGDTFHPPLKRKKRYRRWCAELARSAR